jgi:hypothetical protein
MEMRADYASNNSRQAGSSLVEEGKVEESAWK